MASKPLYARARGVFRIFAIVSVTWLAVLTAPAALRFDVFTGYDGTVREASWFPITCEIFNDGPPIKGFIEVEPASYAKGQTQRLPIELPTGTTKRVFIPTFAPGRYQSGWEVRLVDSRGRLIEDSVTIRPQRSVGWETKVVGSLPRTAAGAITLRKIKRNQPDLQPASVRFQTQLFPDNPLVLEGLDAIYLNSEAATSLRASQANALLAWMHAGGHLIVAIEQINDITGVPWLQNVLPVEPKEIVPVAIHPELENWVESGTTVTNYSPQQLQRRRTTRNKTAPVDSDGTVVNAFDDLKPDAAFEAAELRVATGAHRDGAVVIATEGHPLIVTADRDLGRITVLMFSPEREPFKSWKNLETFWTKLVEVPLGLYASTDYNQSYGIGVDGLFGALIDSRQIHKLPVGWLLVLLLVYLVVIGPFDRIWLKKINKPMLTWITFPCYVLFFSGLIYLIGYKLRSGDSEYNELHVVDVLDHGDQAEFRGRTYASIYSPANARYAMNSGLKFATLRGEYLASRGGETSEKATLLHTGDNFKAEVFVPVWTSQLYLSDWWNSGAKPLTASLKPSNDGWLLTVANLSGKPITVARIAVDDQIFEVGAIAAGQTTTVPLNRNNSGAPSLQDFVQNHSQQYQATVQQRQYAFGRRNSGTLDDPATASMVASLLGEVNEPRNGMNFVAGQGLDVSGAVNRGEAILFAWSPNTAPVPALNQTKTKRTTLNTLWRLPVSIPNQN